MSQFENWSDDALRDGVRSGHLPEFEVLAELERRNPSPAVSEFALVHGIPIPTPKELFATK
jgi:hypothetical protein